MSPTLSADVAALLDPSGPAPLAVVTLGNDLRGDDGAGPLLASLLADGCRPGCTVANAGERPESALDLLASLPADQRPARVVFVDAADFGGAPGEARAVPAARLADSRLSTHRFPLAALAALIEEDTGATVSWIGIQTRDVRLGAVPCDDVRRTVEFLAASLRAVLPATVPAGPATA
jgi:hydrogenase 3 maturation protease